MRKLLILVAVLFVAACVPPTTPTLPYVVSAVPHVDTGGWSDQLDWVITVELPADCPTLVVVDANLPIDGSGGSDPYDAVLGSWSGAVSPTYEILGHAVGSTAPNATAIRALCARAWFSYPNTPWYLQITAVGPVYVVAVL